MIQDGDGKDPEELAGGLCRYYDEQNLRDVDGLPRVTRKNVLIQKYYSFENYFLNPEIMTKLGIVKSEEDFIIFCGRNGQNISDGSVQEKICPGAGTRTRFGGTT